MRGAKIVKTMKQENLDERRQRMYNIIRGWQKGRYLSKGRQIPS